MPVQRHERLFVWPRNQNFSLLDDLQLHFVSTNPDCESVHGSFRKRKFFQTWTETGEDMTKRAVSKERASRREGSPWILGFVIVYLSLQILTPLRHLLYKRDLQWTHEGVDFCWRMMADHHETDGGITIEDPLTKDVYLHSPNTLLNHQQLVMVNNPYMLVQYVHFLKGYLKQNTAVRNPIIRADI